MEWRPSRAIAVVLAILGQPFAMLYLGRVKWAIVYLLAPLAIISSEFIYSAPWLKTYSYSSLMVIVCAVHAYFVAARSAPLTSRPWYSRWYGMAGLFVAFVSVVFSARAFFYEPFRMPSGSMLPTIQVGSHMIVKKYGYGNYGTYGLTLANGGITAPLERGDLLVFDYPEDRSIQYIKRLIGLPGDTVVFNDHQLVINGKPVATEDVPQGLEPPGDGLAEYSYRRELFPDATYTVAYIKGIARGAGFEVVVPEDSYFVLGDNRDNSRDSRYWGFVPQENVVGKVIFVTD